MNLERLSALVSTLRMLVLQLRQEIGEGPRPETKPAEDAARKSDQLQRAWIAQRLPARDGPNVPRISVLTACS